MKTVLTAISRQNDKFYKVSVYQLTLLELEYAHHVMFHVIHFISVNYTGFPYGYAKFAGYLPYKLSIWPTDSMICALNYYLTWLDNRTKPRQLMATTSKADRVGRLRRTVTGHEIIRLQHVYSGPRSVRSNNPIYFLTPDLLSSPISPHSVLSVITARRRGMCNSTHVFSCIEE